MYKVENLINWLIKQAPNERYNYNSCKDCLLARYLRYCFPEFVSIGVDWWDKRGNVHVIPNFKELNDIAFKGEWTFGGALERARTYLDNQGRSEIPRLRYGDKAHQKRNPFDRKSKYEMAIRVLRALKNRASNKIAAKGGIICA